MRVPFSEMDGPSRQFYTRIFNTAILNAFAVRHGLFDTLLHETTDPSVTTRWNEAVPQIVATIQLRNIRGF